MTMRIFPVQQHTIKTKLQSIQIQESLQDFVQKEKLIKFFLSAPTKPYEGFVNLGEFQMRRIPTGKNSFIPWVYGKVESDDQGSKVLLTIKLDETTEVLLYIFFGFLFVSMLSIGVISILVGEFFPALLASPIFFGIFYAIVHVTIKSESSIAKKDILTYLNGSEI